MTQPRAVWLQVFTNFINSLRRKQHQAVLIGKDHFGSEYYEFPHKSRGGKKTRWCIPVDYENFEQEIPAEWEAWLRHRRKDPPTQEEIQTNMLKLAKTIENAKKLEKPKEGNDHKDFRNSKFPIYEEFEEEPGVHQNRKVQQ